MSTTADTIQCEVEMRARQSHGISNQAIYERVVEILSEHRIGGGLVADVGCGVGNLRGFVGPHFSRYLGIDAVRYEGFPPEAEFHQVNLDTGRTSLPDA